MTATEREGEAQSLVRVTVDGHGTATVGTGLPVLDHLLGLLAVHGGFDVQLEIAPGAAVLEAASAGRALVSNVDLSDARVAGLDTDIVARFLEGLTEGAELTLHVRLLEGRDTQHVLDAIFKALGISLAQACRPRPGKE